MPIIWILIIGAILYWILQILEKQYALKNEKKSVSKPDATEPDTAAAPVAVKPPPEKPIKARPFIDTISGMPNETKTELRKLDLTTPKAISGASDKKLLAINGIGPARLKQIRAICAEAKDQES